MEHEKPVIFRAAIHATDMGASDGTSYRTLVYRRFAGARVPREGDGSVIRGNKRHIAGMRSAPAAPDPLWQFRSGTGGEIWDTRMSHISLHRYR
jgi:hypothetical protein